MFARKTIICSGGNIADYFCIGDNCEETPFVCDKECKCKKNHTEHCSLKNIPKLTN